MPYNVSFISLGCAKNQVNCEQMMATVQHAGHNVVLSPEGADVAVVNTCGFLASACEEAIDNILEMAELKKEGKLKKIIVTGCMAQRYKDDVLHELPEVDAVLGTGSYGEIARAVDEVMAPGGLRPCYMGDIQNCVQGGARILSTPSWYAYLRIAEGCDNCCAYCVIPRLRGRYRSRPMNELLDEASELASAGVKELIVIAQDITRWGMDLYGKPSLALLLRELAKIDGVVTKVAASVESLEKNEPYLVVQGSGGVMVQGTVSEMNLDKLTVGATVTVNSWDTGEMLTAEVTEIDKTPTSYTNQNGSENPNNSAYPFKAAVTDSNSLSVGSYVSLSFSGAADDVGDTFYLPVSYVRQENGQYYVLRESKDKKLERQNVQTGKIINGGYAIEILSGVSQEDYICFPYGKYAVEGALVNETNGSSEY